MTVTEVQATGRYSLHLSSDREHRDAAQRLRHTVFAAEPGFVHDAADGREADRFDEYCEHLLVRDEITDETVGCYRILTADAARAAGGWYTATEFDISALAPLHGEMVELGRACVHPGHRNGAVLAMMWAGMLNYLDLAGPRWALGCVSVPMRMPGDADDGANVRAVRDRLLAEHASPPNRRVRPLRPVPGMAGPAPTARPVLPPLLRGYLRLGARICGEPAHDPGFGVADFVALLGAHDVDPRYLQRLRSVPVTVR
ncbi:GNAT family N-acetyltransferase [Rhodococcus sp. NPDC058505]|uniref:GNAT family N-acetyltransferase n=1 Tax=unclassified Rhodococcus (in: high G+C Gram-positive bacteria) TaxID=192944 RepID=UPI00364E5E10